ncbi:FHA domain-containing protein [Streptomyces sp. NPDC050560]|uniref:FHA domain-containing protein n=1 Tax=Streptomyces sp. NPDC050560 TaxID=3365630 RepID=UPI00379EDEEE
MTSPFEQNPVPLRMSDAEREETLVVLRDGVAQGKLSYDTFMRRMELALAARRADELAALTADLRTERGLSRAFFGAVEAVSGFRERLRRAWRAERLPKLLLPAQGVTAPLRIGRDPRNGLRLSHATVSLMHAELTWQGGMWVLRDLGSTNGTTVNGRRVASAAVVRVGDQVTFGEMEFRLTE